MKRIVSILLPVILALSLTGCRSSKGAEFVDVGPSETPAVEEEVQAPVQDAAPEETPAVSVPQATHTLTPEAGIPDNAHVASPTELKTIAEAFVGRELKELIEAVGQPLSTESVSAEDSVLHYNGYDVYTHRENGVETVSSVA